MRAVQSLASFTFACWAYATRPTLNSVRQKTKNWDTRPDVLGWAEDMGVLTVTSPPHKRLKLRSFLVEGPASCTHAPAKYVPELAGFLIHMSFAVLPRPFFVHRLLASVGIPRSAAGDDFAGRMTNPRRRVALGPELDAAFELWRWSDDKVVDARVGVVSAPIYHLIERPAQRTFFSDTSKTAVDRYCLEIGIFWRYNLTSQEQKQFCGSIRSVHGVGDLSINVLEVSVWLSRPLSYPSVFVCPSIASDGKLCSLPRNNVAPVYWTRGCVWVCNCGSLPLCVSSAFSKCRLDGISRRPMCVVSTTLLPVVYLVGIATPFLITCTWLPVVYLVGIATPFLITCSPFVPRSRPRFGTWRISVCLSVLHCWHKTHATRRCCLDGTSIFEVFWLVSRLSGTFWCSRHS